MKITIKMLILAALVTAAGKATAGYEDQGLGARPSAMGGAFVAIADDGNALYWNPAGMVQLERQEALFMHGLYGGLANVNFDYLAYVYPMSHAAIGLGWSQTGATLEEGDGLSYVSSRISEDIFYVSMGLNPALFGTEKFNVGGTVKRLTLDTKIDTGSGLGFDFGALYTPFSWLQAGVMLRNVATDVRNEKYNMTTRFGLASRVMDDQLRFALDINTKDGVGTSDGTTYKPHFGVEYQPMVLFAARLGYDAGFITAGAGFDVASVKLDYAYRASELLGASHRISLAYNFGPDRGTRAKEKPALPALAPAKEKISKGIEVTKDAKGQISSYQLGASLAFEKGSTTLSADGVDTLRALILELDKDKTQQIEIYGHSDSSGSAAVNREVTKSRAKAVQKQMIDLGFAASRIAGIHGMGEDQPIADNNTEEGQAQNRRVEFKVLKNSGGVK